MSKCVVEVSYRKYVLDTAKAVALLDILAEAEIYETKWQKEEDGGTLHYIYPQGTEDHIRTLNVLPAALYKIAKLAGKPDKT
jgi:hypothetical protein